MNAHSPIAIGDVEISATDLPFLPPADRKTTIEFPAPISANKIRRIDWAGKRAHNKWLESAGHMILLNGGMRKITKMPGRFEIKIVLDESAKIDADNALKAVCDALKRFGIIVDDSPKYMRRVIVEFGDADTGMRVTLREVG